MTKLAEAHNEAKRWLRRYRKSSIKGGIYRHGIAVAIFFDYADCRSDVVEYTSERDVTSLRPVIHRSIYDLRFCFGEREKERQREKGGKRERQRITRHCKIDDD